MQRFAPQIAYYLEMFRSGDADNAFHGLLEIDCDILPELMAVFRSEQDIEIRELLSEVIWEYRERSVIPFLGEALSDTESRIWRQALNGLVALASPASLEILRTARTRQFPTQREAEEFRRWLKEAIEQTEKDFNEHK
jgi:HEAT repeat protein